MRCTHLVAAAATGRKYEFARRHAAAHKVHIVPLRWFQVRTRHPNAQRPRRSADSPVATVVSPSRQQFPRRGSDFPVAAVMFPSRR